MHTPGTVVAVVSALCSVYDYHPRCRPDVGSRRRIVRPRPDVYGKQPTERVFDGQHAPRM